jgi:hypothetical protein
LEIHHRVEIDDFCRNGFDYLASSHMALTDFNGLRLLLKRYQEQSGLIPSWEKWSEIVCHINQSDFSSFAGGFNGILGSELFEKFGNLAKIYGYTFSKNMEAWLIGRYTTMSAEKLRGALILGDDKFQKLIDFRGWAKTGQNSAFIELKSSREEEEISQEDFIELCRAQMGITSLSISEIESKNQN